MVLDKIENTKTGLGQERLKISFEYLRINGFDPGRIVIYFGFQGRLFAIESNNKLGLDGVTHYISFIQMSFITF